MGRSSKLTDELQRQITELIATGVTDQDACESVGIHKSTFYSWLQEGTTAKTGVKRDFFDAITRARAEARRSAAFALRGGMVASQTVKRTTDTLTETRVRRLADGSQEPYEYRKTTVREETTRHPPDWRAALAYLERRDPENWGRKDQIIIKVLPQIMSRLEDLNIPASDYFEEHLRELDRAYRERLGEGSE